MIFKKSAVRLAKLDQDMKRFIFAAQIFSISFSAVAQSEYLDPKGAKKVRVETAVYYQNDTTKSTAVLYFDNKGTVTKNVKYDQANEPTEMWTYSNKYKGSNLVYRQGKFKDYTKSVKSYKFKIMFTYNNDGKLNKVENLYNASGYEVVYDSIGRYAGKIDFNSKGFYGGSKFTIKENKIVKIKFEQSGKPAEITEFSYDAQNRITRATIWRAGKVIRKEEYTYVN